MSRYSTSSDTCQCTETCPIKTSVRSIKLDKKSEINTVAFELSFHAEVEIRQ